MILAPRGCLAALLLVVPFATSAGPRVPDTADHPIARFLAQDARQPSYRAVRRLEAEHGSRKGWLEAITTYSPHAGFRYQVTAEGGSGYIRSKVLRALLDGERDIIARGESARSSLAPANYVFQPNGIDENGHVSILLSPRRKEKVLVQGVMALDPNDGGLIRVQGRLAKSPTFWLKHVDIVRTYQRINGVVVPVSLETTAQVRFHGEARLRMTYAYSEIDGAPCRSGGDRPASEEPGPANGAKQFSRQAHGTR